MIVQGRWPSFHHGITIRLTNRMSLLTDVIPPHLLRRGIETLPLKGGNAESPAPHGGAWGAGWGGVNFFSVNIDDDHERFTNRVFNPCAPCWWIGRKLLPRIHWLILQLRMASCHRHWPIPLRGHVQIAERVFDDERQQRRWSRKVPAKVTLTALL